MNRTEIKIEEIVIGQEFTIPLIGADFKGVTRYTSNTSCPLAKAFKRYFWLSHSVYVTPDFIKIDEYDEPTYMFDIVNRFGYADFKPLRDLIDSDKDNTLTDSKIYEVKIIFKEKIK